MESTKLQKLSNTIYGLNKVSRSRSKCETTEEIRSKIVKDRFIKTGPRRCSSRQVLLTIKEISKDNTCEKETTTQVFPVKFANILGTPFLQNTSSGCQGKQGFQLFHFDMAQGNSQLIPIPLHFKLPYTFLSKNLYFQNSAFSA